MSDHLLLIDSPLFEEVQRSWIFPDCKTFVDCIPKDNPEVILKKYLARRLYPDFDLHVFVENHFHWPLHISTFQPNYNLSMQEHIESLWNELAQNADRTPSQPTTLIPLPHPYIIPGGRFREIYYWDSYFTSEGLACSGNIEMVVNMTKNFAHLIATVGHVPNGNRTYYRSRSQPPYFSCLLEIIEKHMGFDAVIPFITTLEQEYRFWMDGSDKLTNGSAYRRVVKMPNGALLNRYWDDTQPQQPRPESYRQDQHLFGRAQPSIKSQLFVNIRAACESGWDFSSRWMRDPYDLTSIYTTELIPVDLNSLLYFVEKQLADLYSKLGETKKSASYANAAAQRNAALQYYCWDEQQGFYFDYCWTEQRLSEVKSLAAATPLFFRMSTPQQAKVVAKILQNEFLMPGGFVTTLIENGQQWDKPNGWAPLQWITIQGLLNYDIKPLAQEAAQRWLDLNCHAFTRTHKMLEKYNVCNNSVDAGGGEYPLQDGFGWTNGVALALMKQFNIVPRVCS